MENFKINISIEPTKTGGMNVIVTGDTIEQKSVLETIVKDPAQLSIDVPIVSKKVNLPMEKATVPLPPKPKLTGTLTAKMTEEEIENIEDTFAYAEPGIRNKSLKEAFVDHPPIEKEEEEEFFDQEEYDLTEAIFDKAKEKGIPEKIMKEKVIVATIPKKPIVKKKKVVKAPPIIVDEKGEKITDVIENVPDLLFEVEQASVPIDTMELQAKDIVNQMKKNNGEDYMNRDNKLIKAQVEKVVTVEKELTVKELWDYLLESSLKAGLKLDGIRFKDQTAKTINDLQGYVNDKLKFLEENTKKLNK